MQRAVQEHRDEILEIAERHGASNVRAFGSVARGTAGPDSDLDLLVEMGPNRSPWFPGGLIMDLEELLGYHVDVTTERGVHPVIRDRVLAEARPLSTPSRVCTPAT